MCLKPEQIAVIEDYVQRAGVNHSHLHDELVDHLCCDIESRMRRGLSFRSAYQEIKAQAGQDDLNEIQRDTLFLIDKNYRIMKQSMKTLGIIALVMMALASVAKIMHWPGASILLVISFFLTSLIFYPAVLYTLYKEYFNRTKVFLPLLAFIGGAGFMWGVLFKIQHWPGAGILIAVGELLLAVLLAIIGFSTLKTSKGNRMVTNLAGTVSALGLTLGLLFKIQHWPGAGVMLFFSLILFFAVFIPLYTRRFAKADYVDNRFIFIIFAVGMIAILTTLISIKTSEDVMKEYEAAFITTQLANQRFEKVDPVKQLPTEITKQVAVAFSAAESIRNDLIQLSQPGFQFSESGIIQVNLLQNWDAQGSVNHYFARGAQGNKGYELYEALQHLQKLEGDHHLKLDYEQGIMSLKEGNANLWVAEYFREMPLIAVLIELEQIELALNLAIHY